jgi:acid phosphatase
VFTKRIIKIILLSIAAVACNSSSPEISIMNLDAAKNAVMGYYESGEYDRECSAAVDEAISEIDPLKLKEKSAVVFDVDDTALANYNEIKKSGFGYFPKIWEDWMKEGKAPAVKETKRFYDYLVSKKIRVIFITGRQGEFREPTVRNLIEQGYTVFDTLIIRNDSEKKIPAAEFKAIKREELVKKGGYDIIACIGDQWSDMVGGNTGYKIKLPNYLYLLD